jgi:ketosteroid isomerase-like protein
MAVETRSNVGQEIRTLVDGFARAVREKNIDALMSHYAPELVVFNVAPPLRDKGIEPNRKSWKEWFDSFKGGIDYDVRELTVVGGDDVAFSHSLNHVSGESRDSGRVDAWVRVTVGYRKAGGKWLVTHEHVSMPIDMKTGKVPADLKP